MKLLDTTPRLFNPQEAECLANQLMEDDEDGWTYVVKHDPRGPLGAGYSLVGVYDEVGVFVGYMT